MRNDFINEKSNVNANNAPPRMKPVERCPICETTEAHFLFQSNDKLYGTPGVFTYRRCTRCRTVFQDPMVIAEDLPSCYPSDYYTHGFVEKLLPPPVAEALGAITGNKGLAKMRRDIRIAVMSSVRGEPIKGFIGKVGKVLSLSIRMRERAFFNHVIEELLPFAPGKLRAFEIGCGAGYMLDALKRAGWEAEGVEWDANAAIVAREHTGCNVKVGDFRKVDLPSESFHLVLMEHVLEHINSPAETLKRISELLVPGGRAVLIYPNPDSLGAKIYKEMWFPWDPPRHLVLPPQRALAVAALKFGLKATRIRSTVRFAKEHSALSRAYREGKKVDLTKEAVIQKQDVLLEKLQRGAIRLGLNSGEEAVIVLQKI